MHYNVVNMLVRSMVTIGHLQESNPCESDGDLEIDLDLIFQGHFLKLCYKLVNMLVRSMVTIGHLQESGLWESDGDLGNDLDLNIMAITLKIAIKW